MLRARLKTYGAVEHVIEVERGKSVDCFSYILLIVQLRKRCRTSVANDRRRGRTSSGKLVISLVYYAVYLLLDREVRLSCSLSDLDLTIVPQKFGRATSTMVRNSGLSESFKLDLSSIIPVHSIIFLAPVSPFDQYLEEDPSTNRLVRTPCFSLAENVLTLEVGRHVRYVDGSLQE